MDYRHELKFLVSDYDIAIIRYRIQNIMKLDSNAQGTSYTIRSVYFDDIYNSCLQENEDGVDNRSKFRIRIYNGDSNVIKLEKKSKKHGMTHKLSAVLTKEEAMQYLYDSGMFIEQEKHSLKREFNSEKLCRYLLPKVIVEYERIAFVEKLGNVRVTFDRNIGGTARIESFFDKSILPVPLLQSGFHILEVKYDELLPDYIANALEIATLQQISFSKYYYARKRGNINEF